MAQAHAKSGRHTWHALADLPPGGLVENPRQLSILAEFVMADHDLLIIGAGISGPSMAHYAAETGLNALVLERDQWVGRVSAA